LKIINNEIIESIKSRIDIVDYIGELVNLKKTGSNYKGLCPFHSEKTASFVVSSEKQIFKCFGCGKAGDLISFVKETKNLEFNEAIDLLARSCGLELKETNIFVKNSYDKKTKLNEILIIARDYFVENLAKSEEAKLYLEERKLNNDTVKQFELGYALNSWDKLSQFFIKKNINLALAVEAGLLREKNQKYYDYFRDRIMFPIYNHRGELLAFGGRTISKDKNEAKYINSPESELYTKGNELYGINNSFKDIKEQNTAILVEGYMDLLSLYSCGFKNVIACLGTAFTVKQAKLLKKFTDNALVFFDGDNAGSTAAEKAFAVLASNGITSNFVSLENKMDPDDATKYYSIQDLKEKLKSAKPLILKIINTKISEAKNINDKNKAISSILNLISLFTDELEKTHLVNELSFRSKIPFKELIALIKKDTVCATYKARCNFSEKTDKLYINLIKSLYYRPDFCIKIVDDNLDQYLPNELRNLIYELKEQLSKNEELSLNFWLNLSKKHKLEWVEEIVCKESLQDITGKNIENEFTGCITMFKINYFEKKRKTCLDKINSSSEEKTLREYSAIVKEINNLKHSLANFK